VREKLIENATDRRSALRERLVRAAQEAIATRGLGGLKARDVAAAAGCALGAIYTAFDDLDELILRVNALTLARLEAALKAPSSQAPEDDVSAELSRLARAYLDFARREEPSWRALFEHRLAAPPLPAWYAEARNRFFSLLEAPLARLLPQEEPAARVLLARTLFSAVHGIVSLGMEQKFAPTPAGALDALLDRFVRLAAAGLLAAQP
jgi:AcrR family transcriptional regulator